ncbi:hypothetical protein H4Q26_013117 [Puccinia striiformis f. sp. tritici PST-130]|nr:hypothetical protein H4Q26_013117 [Puccinia striiformis f. sp. tritici PST-130]
MSAERLSQCPAARKSGRLHSTKLKFNPPNQIDDHDHQQTRMAGVPNRGGTANNRPRTGVSTSGGRPTTAQNHNNNKTTWWMMTCTLTKNGKKKKKESSGRIEEEEEEEEDDEDEGMFSFAPHPKTQQQTHFHHCNHHQRSTNHINHNNHNSNRQPIEPTHQQTIKPIHQTSKYNNKQQITPAAAIIAQYHQNPETRLRKLTNGTPNSTGMNSRGFSSAIPLQTANSVEDAPVIELRSGFNNASRRAAVQEGDRDSLKSGSSHSLHKVDYYHNNRNNINNPLHLNSNRNSTFRPDLKFGTPNPDDPNNYGLSSIGMKEMDRVSMGEVKLYSDTHSHLSGGLENYNIEDFEMDEEDSPYPEVRASVSNIDDPEMPCLTFRAWVLGLFS